MGKTRLQKLSPLFRTPRAAPAKGREELIVETQKRLLKIQRDLVDTANGFERGDLDLEDLCPHS